jgi:hypothetical protein
MIYASEKLSRMQTRKGKIQIAVVPTLILEQTSLNISNMNIHDGREHYLNYDEIYGLFQNERFPPQDKDINEYKNIHKSEIDIVTSHPNFFPYNDGTLWCFTHVKKYIRMITNASGVPIASLNKQDIRIHYKTLEPTIALDESFLDKFWVDHMDLDWPLKKGERYIPNTLPKRPIHDLKCNDLQALW